MEDPDSILVERWHRSRGEDREQVFLEIYQRFYPGLLRLFLRRGFSEEDSRDLVQDVFFRVAASLDSFRSEGSLGGWVFKIAMSVYRNELRRRSEPKRNVREVALDPLSEHGIAEIPGLEPSALDALLEHEARGALRAALDELPLQMRQCAVLRFEHSLKYREIAVLMRLSVDTVKAHLAQARQRLQRELGDSLDEA